MDALKITYSLSTSKISIDSCRYISVKAVTLEYKGNNIIYNNIILIYKGNKEKGKI